MKTIFRCSATFLFLIIFNFVSIAQKSEKVQVIKDANEKKVTVLVGGKPFTTFLFSADFGKTSPVPYFFF